MSGRAALGENAESEVHWQVDCTLTVSADGLSALLHLPAGAQLALAGLKNLLTAHHVHAGLETGALLAATRPATVERTLVVAHGRLPVAGANGSVELLVKEPTEVYGDGTVDLHEMHHFREIYRGTPVARLLPPTPGVPGFDVHGVVLPAKAGTPAEFGSLLGPGNLIDEHDPTLARAADSGIYQRFTRGGTSFIQILHEVTVPGDIDLTIGNISSRYPVVVQGDVHATFSLKSQQAITIKGSVEDARISARGDLTVQGGILRGRTRVKAHGDIRARHIESRVVKARHVHADLSIHFSSIRATGDVNAKDIIGGEILAAGSVTCDVLGDPDGQPTIIQVGVDPGAQDLMTWARERHAHLADECAVLRERCQLLAHRVQTRISAGDDHVSEDHALRQAVSDHADLQATALRCQNIIATHADQLAHASALVAAARIIVKRQINPGVILRIGPDIELAITEARPGGFFYRTDDRIWDG